MLTRFILCFPLVLSSALVVAESPDSLESYLIRAQQLEERRNYSGAEETYKKAMAAFPNQPEVVKRLGIIYQTEQKLDASIEAFQKVLQEAPSYPQVNLYLAVSCLRLGRIDDSLKALSKELALNPGARQTRTYLASVYQSLGRNLEAVQPQEVSPRGSPQDAEALYQLLSRMEKDLDKGSGTALLHILCAQIYEHDGQYTNAIREHNVALRMRPDFPAVHISLGHDYWKMGRMDKSEEELRKGLRDDPRNSAGNYDMAAILAAKQKFQEAVPLLRVSISGRSNFMAAHLLLGKCYASLGDVKNAIQEISRAVQLNPKEPSPHYLLARLYARSSEKEKSEHEFALFEKLSLQQKEKISKRLEEYVETQKERDDDH